MNENRFVRNRYTQKFFCYHSNSDAFDQGKLLNHSIKNVQSSACDPWIGNDFPLKMLFDDRLYSAYNSILFFMKNQR